jgi:hypothetical protein
MCLKHGELRLDLLLALLSSLSFLAISFLDVSSLSTSPEPQDVPVKVEVGDPCPPDVVQGAARLQEKPEHYLVSLGSQGGEEHLPLLGAEGAEVGGHNSTLVHAGA